MRLRVDSGRRTAWLLGVGALLLVALVAVLVLPSEQGVAGPEPSASSAEAEKAAKPRPAGDPPNRLVVPSLGMKAPLQPIEVTPDGVLTPPKDGDVVGWWKRSAHPGARKGQTVLTGHTFRSGPAAMNELGEVAKGDAVRVHDDGVVVHYRVTRVVTYSVQEVAERAYDLFAQDRGDGRLVLVTCTDYVNGDYQSNVIVFAEPTGRETQRRSA
ncbi:MAG TPA: class F sortase [Nocardioidaceae bacterium]